MDIASFFQPTILLGNEKDKEKIRNLQRFLSVVYYFGMVRYARCVCRRGDARPERSL